VSHEHESHSPERQEQDSELNELRAERLEAAENRHSGERAEDKAEQAEAARRAIEKAAEHQPAPAPQEKPKERDKPITHYDKEISYKHTMQSLQRHMSPAQRTFSKVIHQPAVEKTSDALAKTVFRPSVTVGATVAALVAGGASYLIARHYGYGLAGSEFLIFLVIGGVVGVVVEGLSRLFRRFRDGLH
jgi:hypothetical protein